MNPTFRIKANLLLLSLMVAMFFLNFSTKTLFFRPCSIHQWRQSDCLSITKNYYEEGMHFFQPKVHYQGPEGGKAVSECPLLNYSVAGLWKIFGEHEFIYRLLEYIIFLTALFVFFNMQLTLHGSSILSFLVTGLIATSPLLEYYGMNFIADVPAFSFGLIGFSWWCLFCSGKNERFLYGALVIGTIAVLMKASALMAFCLCGLFIFLDVTGLGIYFGVASRFTRKWIPAAVFICAIAVVLLWYDFALTYNKNKSNNIFLLTVLPIWKMEDLEIYSNLRSLFNIHFPMFLNRPMLFVFLTSWIMVLVFIRQLPAYLKIAFVCTSIYFLLYLIFFFQVFSVHDYYLINLMILPAVTFLSAAVLVNRYWSVLLFRRFFVAVTFIVVPLNALYSAAIYRLRMIEDDKMTVWYPFISLEEKNLAKYLFWDYGRGIRKIENFGPELRKHGIKRDDFTLVIPDNSFDISLYFLDQKGFQVAREHFENVPTILDLFRNKKIKYLVLSDTTLNQTAAFKSHQHWLKPFFSSGGVNVYHFSPNDSVTTEPGTTGKSY